MKRLADAERDGEAYAKGASIAELRKLAADKLRRVAGGWPIIDGWVIPDDQHKLYEAGKYNDMPILIGYNSDEGASFWPPKTPEDYIANVKTRYGKFADDLIKAYPVGTNTVPKTARDLTRDAAFGWQTWSWARLAIADRKVQGVLLLFRPAPGLSGRFAQGGLRFAAWRRMSPTFFCT